MDGVITQHKHKTKSHLLLVQKITHITYLSLTQVLQLIHILAIFSAVFRHSSREARCNKVSRNKGGGLSRCHGLIYIFVGGGTEHHTLLMHRNGKLGDEQTTPLIDTYCTIALK